MYRSTYTWHCTKKFQFHYCTGNRSHFKLRMLLLLKTKEYICRELWADDILQVLCPLSNYFISLMHTLPFICHWVALSSNWGVLVMWVIICSLFLSLFHILCFILGFFTTVTLNSTTTEKKRIIKSFYLHLKKKYWKRLERIILLGKKNSSTFMELF